MNEKLTGTVCDPLQIDLAEEPLAPHHLGSVALDDRRVPMEVYSLDSTGVVLGRRTEYRLDGLCDLLENADGGRVGGRLAPSQRRGLARPLSSSLDIEPLRMKRKRESGAMIKHEGSKGEGRRTHRPAVSE